MSEPRLIRCQRCRRTLNRGRGRTAVPAHKCPHRGRCLDVNDPAHCTACRAVLEAIEDVLRPACVFCTLNLKAPGRLDCYTPSYLRGGCAACGAPGTAKAGVKHGDPDLLAEIEAEMSDVFAVVRVV